MKRSAFFSAMKTVDVFTKSMLLLLFIGVCAIFIENIVRHKAMNETVVAKIAQQEDKICAQKAVIKYYEYLLDEFVEHERLDSTSTTDEYKRTVDYFYENYGDY